MGEYKPWGLILFKRNIVDRAQVSALVSHFRELVGRADAPVLIDQEGGRVQRMGPPEWLAYPAGRRYGELYATNPLEGLNAARLVSRLMAQDLHEVGINVDCVPLLDVPQPDGHDVIGDRAYGTGGETIMLMARAIASGMMEGGVLPVIKHIPGHGRATVDSHLNLPVVRTSADVLRQVDFPPFAALADLPMAMTAHVVYTAFDTDAPATLSKTLIEDVIRREIQFDGLLMSDDLSMKALTGSMSEKVQMARQAGVDMMLHCNGELTEMREVAKASGKLEGLALVRANRTMERFQAPSEYDRDHALYLHGRLIGESV
jgi:beta-N-acetylhexosaminidase